MRDLYKHTINQKLWLNTKVKVKIVSPTRGVYKDALRLAINSLRREYDKLKREDAKWLR